MNPSTLDEIAKADIDPIVYIQLCDCDWKLSEAILNEYGDYVCTLCGKLYDTEPLYDVECEIEKLDNVIRASEDWSKQYEKSPDQLAMLVKAESRLERILRKYFRDTADRITARVNWYAYDKKLSTVQADNTDDFEVIVELTDGPPGSEETVFIQTVFDPIALATTLGAQSGEVAYVKNLGISQTTEFIQEAARERTAGMVGMKYTKDGLLVENPKAAYSITETTRAEIRQSIKTSIALRENKEEATLRLRQTISNPKRAETISRTETVNAYQDGLLKFGHESDAAGKEWKTVNFKDVCGQYAGLGIVELDYVYDKFKNLLAPAAHPNCRCSLRLVYPEELEK